MIQDNLQLFSFKFSNLPGCCGLGSGLGQDSNPADFWQIGRILLKKSGISTSFLRRNASKFNKKATLPIIYALNRFATPSHERKGKTTTKRCHQASNSDKNKQKNQLKQWHLFLHKKH
ncbi:hypothetical protein GL272_06975 [Aeromonas veronii]|uniref:hypothetical protein n=1 Tax=Aeromonas TaxID=642 RepID=UPI001603459E|nr:hypothetical protein [Aeromonas veronii]MBL0631287.1 hypothetical protein [Aeromonas veronii]MBW3776686.1 hypothetical protein [Aeromonas veronii]HDO1323330.1 hypothetical protein [Aeromonas veronii]HDO1383495.1 hypothetical protein [Aeromonas veronii]